MSGSKDLRGFMRTGAALMNKRKKLVGLILELVNGKNIDELISKCRVLRIGFLQQILQQVSNHVL